MTWLQIGLAEAGGHCRRVCGLTAFAAYSGAGWLERRTCCWLPKSAARSMTPRLFRSRHGTKAAYVPAALRLAHPLQRPSGCWSYCRTPLMVRDGGGPGAAAPEAGVLWAPDGGDMRQGWRINCSHR